MADEFPYDVFLSHSAKDQAVVRPLAERLRQDGLKVWFDEWIPSPAGAGEGGRRPGEGRGAKADSIPAKIEEGLLHFAFQPLAFSLQPFPDAPIKGFLAQFLYINWRPALINYRVDGEMKSLSPIGSNTHGVVRRSQNNPIEGRNSS